MSKQEQHKAISVFLFRERPYEVNLEVRNDKMIVQVQDDTTTDQWRNSFDARHIEELTRKTGNFKQFRVFVNMLESAIKKASDCVSLELLTYSDLENLRQRKSNPKSRSLSGGGLSELSCDTPSKRYLILTYSAEFDRIHYPLALPYAGKSDPIMLQETIRELKKELELYKQKASYKQPQQQKAAPNLSKLQRKYEALLKEKEELETAYEALQEEMEEILREGGGGVESDRSSNKDTRTLKKIIKNMEEDMLKEKTKYQRVLLKKTDEMKNMVEEVEELRSTERALNTRVKSLTNEIALLKRNSLVRGRTHSGSSDHNNYRRAVPASSDWPFTKRYRSSSAEGCINSNTGGDHGRRERYRHGTGNTRSRTPSPKGKSFQRFDPTSYVLNKRKQQEEVNRRLGRHGSRSSSAERSQLPPRPSPSSLNSSRRINIGKSRSSSVGSRSSCSSCTSSDDEENVRVYQHVSSRYHVNNNNKKSTHHKSDKKRTESSKGTKRLTRQAKYSPITANAVTSSTPSGRSSRRDIHNDSNVNDNSMEIQEIDARICALQQFMKKSLETVRNTRSCP
ncbi:PREDICTED: coiled-coil domain-containing protein 61-like isoform X1 [Amphimedon queenslandica]|nr:PREDICTED: coiled-coil domain-containing protein 61-like isoform X1 [Amphimedon queenslandica]|eukprot:XP_019855245.1 PREDICTED: coiled-coil domain-containing protein 61-like isoform X1 [Amphimedon queenslandica]